jgi:hypothetical protein
MTTLLIDLWHDLREKRLWPVAVGLLAATAAIPLLLFKPASSEPVTGPIASSRPAPGPQLPAVTIAAGPTSGSTLDTFKQKDPFQSMADLQSSSPQPGGSTKPPSSSPGPSSGSGKTSGSVAGSGASGGGSSKGSTGSSTKGSTGGGTTGGSGSSTPTVQWFSYTADFSFGTPDHMKTMKKVPTLTVLPDAKVAAIVFMGVSADGKHANFFIGDTNFQPQGEGKCNAKGSACRVVTLSLSDSHNEEAFVSKDGSAEYDVKLLAINRSSLSDAQGKSAGVSTKKVGAETGAGVAAAGKGAFAGDSIPLLSPLPAVARQLK